MGITSKVELCNLALSHLGNYGSITNIDTPTESKEITFALWYDISRQVLLKTVMPNFALKRQVVGLIAETDAQKVQRFGSAYAYQYPANCLKVLGIGNVEDKENNFSVEDNMILTDEAYTTGLPIRFVRDVSDVNSMSVEFKLLLAMYLAIKTCLEITQDPQKLLALKRDLPAEMSILSGMNAQENQPIRKSVSRFRAGRWGAGVGVTNTGKK
jgi:hypothetical protein